MTPPDPDLQPTLDRARLPFVEQVQLLRGRLLNPIPTATWRDLLREHHDHAWAVAGATKADLLADLGAAVERTAAEGKSIEWFRQQFDAIVERTGWAYKGGRAWRTRVIYTNNLSTSYAAGRLVQLRDPDQRRLQPYWVYRHADGVASPRPLHESWNGLALPADHGWFATHYPPNDWGCHCWVEAASEAQARRKGYRIQPAPPDDGVDPQTGRPAGIGEGWDYAPGASVAAEIQALVDRKLPRLPKPLGAALAADRPPPRLPAALARLVADDPPADDGGAP